MTDQEWGLVYNEPRKQDALLAQRYDREETAVRVAIQIAKQYVIQNNHPWLMLEARRSSQNVVSVASKITGKTYCTIRPVRAAAFLAGGRAPAPPQLDVQIQALLDWDLE